MQKRTVGNQTKWTCLFSWNTRTPDHVVQTAGFIQPANQWASQAASWLSYTSAIYLVDDRKQESLQEVQNKNGKAKQIILHNDNILIHKLQYCKINLSELWYKKTYQKAQVRNKPSLACKTKHTNTETKHKNNIRDNFSTEQSSKLDIAIHTYTHARTRIYTQAHTRTHCD